MKILITGKNGQVGWELQRAMASLGEAVAVDRSILDLTNPDSIRALVREVKPQLIVNSAAHTAVDKAESEPDVAQAVNGVAPGVMAEEAKQLGATLIHYSTDYVFDGTKNGSYVEDDPACPLSVYGKTKLAGEDAIRAVGVSHLILRTSWVYGIRGKNFLLTILRLAKERDELKIVSDQIGAPTWSRMIAETTAQIVAQRVRNLPDLTGVYNFSAAGATSWHGFADAIVQSSGLDKRPRLLPIPSSEYPLPAPRPKNSVFSNDKLRREFGVAMPDWQLCLELAMQDLAG